VTIAVRAALGAALGSIAGALCLGAGGRVAMWTFAVATGRPPVVTLGGTLTVVAAGSVAGLLGGIPFGLLVLRLPESVAWRGLLSGTAWFALLSPGITPPRPLTFALFAPCFLAYGLLLAVSWRSYSRQRQRYRASDKSRATT
jgi:hypothetical protein